MNRPASVTVAFWLVVIQAILNLISGVIVLILAASAGGIVAADANASASVGAAAVSVVLNIVMIVITLAMLRGRNWARLVIIVLSVLNVGSAIIGLIGGVVTGFDLVSEIVSIVLPIVVIVLLTVKPSRDYFTAPQPLR